MDRDPAAHVLSELGFAVSRRGDELHGSARIRPEMLVPGTSVLRMSILATWVDMLAGLLAVGVIQPRVPVTLHLDVDLHEPPANLAEVHAVARLVKAGAGSVVSTVDLRDETGRSFGSGTGLFVVARDPALVIPGDLDDLVAVMAEPRGPLTVPFAERTGCEQVSPGTFAIDFSPERSNASGTLNGGLLALLAEEASLADRPGATLASMTLRYLRSVRVGPAIATAQVVGDLAEVEITDGGRDEVLAVLATTRCFRGGAALAAPAAAAVGDAGAIGC
ncbi:PaaI family thioesterase [Aquihabitans sp. McL0605]|uniref:PaaI family thioesterase n=1 Tax=Aquihabitans sp. McL0605 TaxID=3415671 RepID=UPI003CF61730